MTLKQLSSFSTSRRQTSNPSAAAGVPQRSAVTQRPAPRPVTIDTFEDVKRDGALLGAGGRVFPMGTPLSKVRGVLPDNGVKATGRAILVNGIMTDARLQRSDMQALANTGLEVVGIHNATAGLFNDLAQSAGDKLGLSGASNKAYSSTANAIFDALVSNQPVHVVGHSQGALIIANALEAVQRRLENLNLSREQVDQKLGLVTVETFGGAGAHFVDGPKYTHWVNVSDAVPMLTGVGQPFSHPGKNAVIRKFSKVNEASDLPALRDGLSNFFARYVDRTTHGPQDIYFPER